jgi:hypothetical protein
MLQRPGLGWFAILLGIALVTWAPMGGLAQDYEDDSAVTALKKQPPPIVQVAGTWQGTATQQDDPGSSGTGPMTLVLTQNAKKIGGSFTIDFGDQTPSGWLKGNIKNNTLSVTFHATSGTDHACTAAVVATVNGNAMSGTFLVKGNRKHCKGKGTFDLQRQ